MPLSRTVTAAFAALILAGTVPAIADAPIGYDYTVTGGTLEIHFHGIPYKAVHIDDAQGEAEVEFAKPVDGAPFDRLPDDLPNWIAVAFSDFDSAVIRANRPVTFAARAEPDGFSLRLSPRGYPPPPSGPAPQSARLAPPEYPGGSELRGPYGSGDFREARAYYAAARAVHPDDETLRLADERAGPAGNSGWGVDGSWHQFPHATVIGGDARGRLALGGGLSLIGAYDTMSAKGAMVRALNGSFAPVNHEVRSGSAGMALDLSDGGMASAEVLAGGNLLGGRVHAFFGSPTGHWDASLTYHRSYSETPEAVAAHADKDEARVSTAQHLGDTYWGGELWGGGGIDAARYGVHGDADAVKTLGWNADLRYTKDFDGLLAGLTYDGLGEYIIAADKFTGAAPSPYTPLSIRTREIHMGLASLSTPLFGNFGFNVFGGYAVDRYASNGAVAGAMIDFRPMPAFDLAFGLRYSRIALTQGETGAETLAGLTLNIGFDSAPASMLLR